MEKEKTTKKLRSRVSPEVLRLSWEDKRQLCEEWQSSGLSKALFCTQKKLAVPTFQGWLSRFHSELRSQFCPIAVIDEVPTLTKTEPMLLEVLFPNAVTARIQATELQFGFLLKELVYAATTVR